MEVAQTSGSEPEKSSEKFINSFKVSTSRLVDRFLKYIKFEDFKHKYYPEIYKNDPVLLKEVYEQFLVQLKQSITGDIDNLCNDQDICPKLEELENLAVESELSGDDTPAWRPSGDPNEDIRDHKLKYKISHKKLLESLLENLQTQNEQLEKGVMAEHEGIMALKDKIDQQDAQNNMDLSALENVDLNMIDGIQQLMDFDGCNAVS